MRLVVAFFIPGVFRKIFYMQNQETLLLFDKEPALNLIGGGVPVGEVVKPQIC